MLDDERIGTNELVDAPKGYPDLLTWLVVLVQDARLGGLLIDPIFVLLAWKKMSVYLNHSLYVA